MHLEEGIKTSRIKGIRRGNQDLKDRDNLRRKFGPQGQMSGEHLEEGVSSLEGTSAIQKRVCVVEHIHKGYRINFHKKEGMRDATRKAAGYVCLTENRDGMDLSGHA